MHTLLSIAFASAAGSLIACSAYDGSGLPAANPADPTFNDGEGGVLKNIGKGGDGGVSNPCATASATPTPLPVSLVFMFDKSGSMSENAKWPSCQQGLSAFFGDPSSVGLSASIQFFPQNSNQCSSSIYQTPTVAMHTLPDAADFNNAMKANSPGGETPTLPAMTGAIAYAQQIQKQQSIGKVAVVLVTDGQPNVCGSTMQAVSVEAKTGFSAGIPTFVIGVGNTGNLNAIAAAGGTIATMRGYRLAPLVWGVGMSMAVSVGYLRIAADKHYFSDVMTGAVVGSIIGVGIPLIFHSASSSSSASNPNPPSASSQALIAPQVHSAFSVSGGF